MKDRTKKKKNLVATFFKTDRSVTYSDLFRECSLVGEENTITETNNWKMYRVRDFGTFSPK